MPAITRLTLVLSLTLLAIFADAAPTATEQRIVEAVDRNNADAGALLERVVNVNSGTMNLKGVKAVGEIFMAEFGKLEFNTRWVDGSAFDRAGHLVAEHKGTGDGPKILLIGHLDTVFEPDSPFQSYAAISDTQARGPGIADMKGGNVIILQALNALREVGALAAMDITVVMTGDEELSGRPLALSKQALVEAAQYADIALGFENGDGNPATANVSRRGSIGWTLQVHGKPAHSSQIFREDIGPGAIYEAARILTRFYTELRQEDLLTFNPGTIVGGTTVTHDHITNSGTAYGKDNIIAETAIVTGDIRAISEIQLSRVKMKMLEIVAANYPHTSASIEFSEGYPAMAPTAGNQRLLEMFSGVSRDLGFGEVTQVNPLRAGAADVSFTADYVEMALDGLGMGGTEGHTVGETGDLTTLPMQAKRAAVLLLRLQQAR
ncbi:MAG: M20/M25/M40 family metallo-hydrolase [Pseudomonadales bacterium]|jgi:glutamate carboxypeptidase|nr:M20/M25/M40 family metallo-hydrolase [Pseudomonadales bacterium]MDP4875430.1 M20/M25/M40 family metallo-hydrolase [Pseudomonadales bacterium]MDP4911241.1 M20/M25/M40 family metallo-hydrolase [Pseudomonadales bacterium]MDP5059246.1 M20/M25/M40 family metallo-hydrolase [Pseudomonadales bacterium]